MRFCLFGASSDTAAPLYFEKTAALGEEMARRGIGMVFGGGATGLMGAACRGMKAAGGEITGIAPRFFDQEGVLSKDCTRLILTDTMRQRKQLMEEMSDGFIVTPGGIGTLEEFFEMYTLLQLDRHQKPIALYNVSGYYDKLIDLLRHTAAEGFLAEECLSLLGVFSEPAPLLDYLTSKAGAANSVSAKE